MTEDEALEHARKFLLGWLDVRRCEVPVDGLYGFDPEKELLFEVERKGPLAGIGASTYLAVHTGSGVVRVAGTAGE